MALHLDTVAVELHVVDAVLDCDSDADPVDILELDKGLGSDGEGSGEVSGEVSDGVLGEGSSGASGTGRFGSSGWRTLCRFFRSFSISSMPPSMSDPSLSKPLSAQLTVSNNFVTRFPPLQDPLLLVPPLPPPP